MTETRAAEHSMPTILVVDDEASVRHVLRTFLTKQGCEVVEAGSAEEAAALLSDVQPAIVLSDIIMPGRSGIDLLGQVKRRYPETEVILITSYGSVDSAIKAIRKGAFDYLQKPFTKLDDVWSIVEHALEKREQTLRAAALDREHLQPSRQF